MLVLVSTTSPTTGPAKGVLQWIRHCPDAAVAFEVRNFRPDDGDDALLSEARAAGADTGSLREQGRNYLALMRQARQAIADHEIDVVQSHGFKPAALCCALKLLCGVRWICFMHGTTHEDLKVRLFHFVESVAQLMADRVVLVSEAQRQRPLQRWSRARTQVIHNAVDTSAPVRWSAGRESTRQALGVAPETPLIAAVGRLSPEKGVDVLIDALAAMGEGRPLTHAVIVGDGPQRQDLVARVERLGLAERVHFVGHSSTPGDYLLAADVVVLPSRSEGIPNVALEAMALGRPLIATAVGGTPEVVEDGASGLLVAPEDPPALARAIARVTDDAAFAQALAAGGERRVSEEFSIAARCEKILAVYAEVAPRCLTERRNVGEPTLAKREE
ncbi:MAG: glycosyltransferase family 4 protein [Halofilum sp. (in: g-proteobacteria)]